jgi:hypothetical protein
MDCSCGYSGITAWKISTLKTEKRWKDDVKLYFREIDSEDRLQIWFRLVSGVRL